MVTIFYSWQSDRPNPVNRNLIKRALEDAVEALNAEGIVEDAIRIDHDTQGVPGSPAIIDTILEKIENCDVFVPDVSFVTDNENRLCPNPNVMIEYGYALKAAGSEKIVAVMNTHYGTATELPFDMRHRRFPISYNLSPDADTITRPPIREQLTRDLRAAIQAIIENRPVPQPVPLPPFQRKESFDHGATFEPVNQPFRMVRGNAATEMRFPEGPKMFLRLIPRHEVPEISRTEASEAMQNMECWPLGSSGYNGWGPATNRQGACQLARYPENDELVGAISQVHLNRELWGVENYLLRRTEAHARAGYGDIIPTDLVRRIFIDCLGRYLRIASQRLALPLPYIVVAGLVNIEGYTVALAQNRVSAPIVDQAITREFLIEDITIAPEELLRPFFSAIYDAVGIRY